MYGNQHYIDNLYPLTRVCYMLGAIRLYKDGDATGVLWRYWHPLAWLMIPCLIVVAALMYGVPAVWRERSDIGIGVSPSHKLRPDKLEWVT